MRLYIAGGCGEHGRNCFLLEGTAYNIMVDCGIMAGSQSPMPRVTPDQIRRTRYVLLTHSHKDHTGALGWLHENGFTGSCVMTAETARQLPLTVPEARMLPVSKEVESIDLDGASIKYGMSGHCPGAVWYFIRWEGKRIFFSGDYNPHSRLYRCMPVKGRKADVAVVDSCYAESKADRYLGFIEKLANTLDKAEYTLLPAPKYGRGLELLLLLAQHFPQVCISLDSHFQSEMACLKSMKKWMRSEAYEALRQWTPRRKKGGRHVLLLADPQLTSTVGRFVGTLYAQEQYPILFSGTLDEDSRAWKLTEQGLAKCVILPVHNSDKEYRRLMKTNHFKQMISCHTDRQKNVSILEI